MQVETETRKLILNNDELEKVKALLLNSFNEGLKRDTNPISPVKMFPTFVREVPDEKYGKFKLQNSNKFQILIICHYS